MVLVAQLVRALDCGSRGRGFKSHLAPSIFPNMQTSSMLGFFLSPASILSAFELEKDNMANQNYPFKEAKLTDCEKDLSKRWYISFYVWSIYIIRKYPAY